MPKKGPYCGNKSILFYFIILFINSEYSIHKFKMAEKSFMGLVI